MTILVSGRDAVMDHLESAAMTRAGQVGVYALAEDDRGTLILIAAGHLFSGSGSMPTILGGTVQHEDGIVHEIIPSPTP